MGPFWKIRSKESIPFPGEKMYIHILTINLLSSVQESPFNSAPGFGMLFHLQGWTPPPHCRHLPAVFCFISFDFVLCPPYLAFLPLPLILLSQCSLSSHHGVLTKPLSEPAPTHTPSLLSVSFLNS